MKKKRTEFSPDDHRWMGQALRLARRGLGMVEPNPMVGAVIVKPGPGGGVIGRGFHRYFGGPHAEVNALKEAGASARGATLHISLEPCCHWGKTPPCTDAILAAGIRRVVVAMRDPFAKVRGKGISLLRKAGVQVDVGLLDEEARAVNASFITRITHGRPFVIAKWAQSIDGCIAMPSGESRWISSETSRAFVQTLRGRVDAIMIGIGTALADNPSLLPRPNRGRDIKRVATRIILDSNCRLPLDSQLVKTVSVAPTLVVHQEALTGKAAKRRDALANRGVMTLGIAGTKDGLDLTALLQHLGNNDYANILVEGGSHVMGTLLRENLIDEAHIFLAPLIIGETTAPHAVQGLGITELAKVPRWHFNQLTQSGPDIYMIGRRK